MSTDNKNTVQLTIILMPTFQVDMEKAYAVGLEIAKEYGALFQGINLFSLINNRETEFFTFITEVDKINKIITKISKDLEIDPSNLRQGIIPAIRPKDKPAPTDSIR